MSNLIKIFIVLVLVSSGFAHARLKPAKSVEEFSGKHSKEHYFLFDGVYGNLQKIDFKGSSQTSLKFILKGQFPELREIKVDGRAAWDPGKYKPTGVLMQILGRLLSLKAFML